MRTETLDSNCQWRNICQLKQNAHSITLPARSRGCTPKDQALGDIAVEVDQLMIKGKSLSGTCTGSFDLEDQTLNVLCNKHTEKFIVDIKNLNLK